MARIETWFNQDLQKPVKVQYLDGNVFSQDNKGNVVGVNVFDGGSPATLSGTVAANVIRSDGGTVAVESGTLSGNKVSVVLPQAAYAVPGVISIIIKLTSGSDITTLCAVVANVYQSSTNSAVDPGTIIPSIETLIAAIEEAVNSIPADYSSLWATLAPNFSTSKAYSPGDYVTYNGALYRFGVAHPAGSWNANHAIAINIGKVLSDDKNGFTDKYIPMTFSAGYYVDKSTGAVETHSSYSASNLVQIAGYSKLLWVNSLAGDAAGYAFYTKDSRYIIGGDGYTAETTSGYGQTVLTVPKNAYYFRCSTHTWYVQASSLYGIVSAEYDPNDLISYPFTLFPGFFISKTTGKLTEYSDGPYSGSTVIPIISNRIYLYSMCSTDDAGYAFLDEEMNLVSSGNCYVSMTNLGEIALDVPPQAVYFRFSTYSTANKKETYVKGVPDRIPGNYYEHISWLSDYAYNLTSDAITNLNGACASEMLFLRELEGNLRGFVNSPYLYKTLYNQNNIYVGYKTSSGTFNPSGQSVSDLDYYSFTLTVSTPFNLFVQQELYFEQPEKKHIVKNVSTVAELQAAMLKAADFATPYRIYDIYVAAGTYDLWNGLDWTQISGSGDDAFKRGLELVSYMNLYGIGNCVLDLTVPSTGRVYSTAVSVLNAHGSECTIRNITLTTYDGRYCVHDDSYPNYTKDHVITWENCVFEYRGRPDATYTTAQHCYGAGFYSGFGAVFRDCVFKGGNSTGNWTGVAIHGHTSTGVGSEVVNEPFYGYIENCSFLGVGDAILPNAMSGGLAHQYDFHVDNCYFVAGNKIHLVGQGGNRLFGGGNSPVDVTQDNTNEVYLVNDVNLIDTLTFNTNISTSSQTYTSCRRDKASGLTSIQIYLTTTANIASGTALIEDMPVPVSQAVNFVADDFANGANTPIFAYVTTAGKLMLRGQLANGHTLLGTVTYFSK